MFLPGNIHGVHAVVVELVLEEAGEEIVLLLLAQTHQTVSLRQTGKIVIFTPEIRKHQADFRVPGRASCVTT